MTLRRTIAASAVLGALVPLSCWGAYYLFRVTFGPWTTLIWPTSVILLADDGHDATLFAVSAVALFGNVILYMAIGAFVWGGIRLFRRPDRRR